MNEILIKILEKIEQDIVNKFVERYYENLIFFLKDGTNEYKIKFDNIFKTHFGIYFIYSEQEIKNDTLKEYIIKNTKIFKNISNINVMILNDYDDLYFLLKKDIDNIKSIKNKIKELENKILNKNNKDLKQPLSFVFFRITKANDFYLKTNPLYDEFDDYIEEEN